MRNSDTLESPAQQPWPDLAATLAAIDQDFSDAEDECPKQAAFSDNELPAEGSAEESAMSPEIAAEDSSVSQPPQVASPCIKATQSKRSFAKEEEKQRMQLLEKELEELKAKLAASPEAKASPQKDVENEHASIGEEVF